MEVIAGLLNLTGLWMVDMESIDLRPLASLEKLEHLSLNDTEVKNLRALRGLSKLTVSGVRGGKTLKASEL